MELVSQFDALCTQVDASTRVAFHRAVDIIDRCIDILSIDRICFSFNGGKDSTVILHLLRVVLAKRALASIQDMNSSKMDDFDCVFIDLMKKLPVLYLDDPDEFPQVFSFVQHCIKKYHLQCAVKECSFIEGIEEIINQRGIQAFVMGMRKGDPGSQDVEHFAPSSKGWPAFFRVNPILTWRYDQVWTFLKGLDLEYCSLYDEG
jgi:FAD synthetase